MTTKWECTECHVQGRIRHKADESVWAVIDKLRASHYRNAGHQKCDLANMRVTLIEPKERQS